MSELQQFHDDLIADVIAESVSASELDAVRPNMAFKEIAFTGTMLADLEAAGVLESPVPCFFANTTARSPFKINAYCLPEDETRLDLVISDFRSESSVQKLTAAEIDRSFKLALQFLSFATKNGARDVDSGSEEYAMLREIFDKRDGFDRVHLILVTNAQAVQRKEKERREELGGYQISYEIWDLERLRRFRSSGATHEPVTVDLSHLADGGLPCVPVSDAALGYQTCVAIFPGQVLYELYEEYGSRLLELNVRSYLQAKGKINREILETLQLQPHLFLAYNNGITVVAEGIYLNETGNLITGLHGLQIVNGGQTTASIHRACKENKADLRHVFVQAKLTVVPADQFEMMVPEISRLSNTQNKVSVVDLGANHPFHIGVERVSRKTWAPGEQSMWFYERARGAFQTEMSRTGTTPAKRAAFEKKFPNSQRVTKEELARYSNTWAGIPHIVSKGGQKNFERFMNGISKVEKGWEPGREDFRKLIGKAILFRRAQRLAKSLGIAAFGINIVTYTVALLAERTARRIDLEGIWERQDLSPALLSQLASWLPQVQAEMLRGAGSRNPGEWFKSEQCWQELRSASSGWKISPQLSAELISLGEELDGASVEVQNAIANCMQVDADTWLKIQIWGNESKELVFWQTGIANTLAGYAAAGWQRRPSEKQAKRAMEILALYQKANPG
jgi:hypothetical protein